MTFHKYYLLLPLIFLYFLFFRRVSEPTVIDLLPNERANATFYMLAQNSDLGGAVSSVTEIEQRFNHKFNYPYVFLNDVPFDDNFKSAIRKATRSQIEFGVILPDHWMQPPWIDEEKAAKGRRKLEEAGVKYGGSVSYRNMCRFNAGFFFQHSLVLKYRWYWRIEPNVQYHCNIDFDPFLFMQENNKTYSFTISTYELPSTIPTLWSTVRGTFNFPYLSTCHAHNFPDFGRKNSAYVAQGNALKFLSHNHGLSYNYCHFWSNFEIADMDFWRAPAYQAFFDYLDQAGGFYYERWGDAPIHSIAAALFLNKNQIHFFDEIGYQHDDWSHCPSNPTPQMECACDPANSFDRDPSSCKIGWDTLFW
ncbi:glycosyltransferase family 15 protein [Macrolepiota fuliginosa MF-IS2]|uniref:Glycosyltransferase family 15 protein n=1 Tax=Macrolepiota fuliginosa MF-IS2 TaxID=1400762 RepID=A0A9P5X2V9_9AGAR|nr:glycosyltransferase family 15 protein [Macrolepiota fuliginosa MF-IS2]